MDHGGRSDAREDTSQAHPKDRHPSFGGVSSSCWQPSHVALDVVRIRDVCCFVAGTLAVGWKGARAYAYIIIGTKSPPSVVFSRASFYLGASLVHLWCAQHNI